MVLDQAQPAELPAHEPSSLGIGSVAALGAITGLGALAASSCCVLPIALGGLGAGAGVFTTVLGVLAPLRVPLMAASILAVVVGWFFSRVGGRLLADQTGRAPLHVGRPQLWCFSASPPSSPPPLRLGATSNTP